MARSTTRQPSTRDALDAALRLSEAAITHWGSAHYATDEANEALIALACEIQLHVERLKAIRLSAHFYEVSPEAKAIAGRVKAAQQDLVDVLCEAMRQLARRPSQGQ